MRISDWSSDVCSSDLKSGGFNATWNPTTLEANVATTGPVGQEVLDSFEIGGKHELLDRTLRVSGAAFLYLYQGKQQSVTGFDASTLSTLGQFINSGDARMYGAEVEISYTPNRRWNINLGGGLRSEEHTSELQSLMRISYAVFCLKKKHKL